MTKFNQSRIDHGLPTLGMTIRGLRLGYRWLAAIGGFLRLSKTSTGNVICVELMPLILIDKSQCQGDRHIVWWVEDNNYPDWPKHLIKPLQNIVKVKRRILFYVNEDGELV